MPYGIDAAVLVEVPVFRRQEGGDDPLRHGRQRKVQPILARVFGDDPAVGGMQARRHRGLVARELRVIWQVGGEMPQQGSDGQRTADQEERGQGRDKAEEAENEAHRGHPGSGECTR